MRFMPKISGKRIHLFIANRVINKKTNTSLRFARGSSYMSSIFWFFAGYLRFDSFRQIWRSLFKQDVAGKVVVIAGASSGMGEHLAYEYGRRGAYLVIGARREHALRQVAEVASSLGSPLAIPIKTDVSKTQDCRRLILEAINTFGQLDYLVLCAGVTPACLFEDTYDVSKLAPAMDINFWGMVYTTHFAAPYLRTSRGRIVVIASSVSWLNVPRLSFYAASKAAVVSFFETLRVEFGSAIGITLVTPGLIESEMTKGKLLDGDGRVVVDQQMRDVVMSATPIERVERLAEAVVDGACRGDKYVTVPPWFRATFYLKMLCREGIDWVNRWLFITEPGLPATEAISKKIVDLPFVKDILWPDSVRSPKIKNG